MEASRELIKAPEFRHEPMPVVTKQDIDQWLFGTDTKLTEKQKALFYAVAIANNLNPVKREIYAVPYGNNFNIITGYEVYLKRAERTGLVEYWEATVKKEGDEYVGLCTIKRRDQSKPVTIEAWEKEYNTGQSLWKTKPRTMLRKVAIAQAFRMVFSEELGGMPYTSDEMGAEPPTVTVMSIEAATVKGNEEDKNLGALVEFDRLVAAKKAGKQKQALEKFLTAMAAAKKVTEDSLKIRASQNFEAFWGAFQAWQEKQSKPAPEPTQEAPAKEAATEAQVTEKAPATGGTGPTQAITDDTLAAIKDAISATGYGLAAAYNSLGSLGLDTALPLEELTEEDAQAVLTWYKNQ